MCAGSRRAFLATLGGASGVAVAGCLGTDDAVSVLSAGSLTVPLEEHIRPAFEDEVGTTYQGEYHGSNAVMRMIEDRQKNPDVAISADATLLRDRLYDDHTDWDVEFASNSVGLAYASDTTVGTQLDSGDPWYEVALGAAPGAIAISDPDLDPLGYRAIQAFRLAEQEHGLDGFAETLAERVSRQPQEPQLLADVETGNRAAAVAYRNMAVGRDIPFLEFPDAYNFSDPELEAQYATVSYTTERGYTAPGRPVVYNATVLDSADNPDSGRAFLDFLLDSQSMLSDAGLTVDSLPNGHGDVPREVLSE